MAVSDHRPDPDALLARVEREETRAGRGKLKIFFGAAAGVGKTCAMLAAAQGCRAEGVDVVAGVVETHGRGETAALLEGLENLPPKLMEHRGALLREMDLDGALRRRPALLLVDELAHNNAPGCRHRKRWQDVEELLAAGIGVYTTLNVQHLESLNDDVGQIAGIRVRETVPDTVFEQADEVELVDLPPDDLLLRLREGKVYIPQQAERASRHFFRKGNLIALREMSLRLTAERVDADMRDYREDHAIREIWQAGERILVCVGPSPISERLVRAGKRLASSLHAGWIVVYVETPRLRRMPPERRDTVLRTLRLAERLGAETATLSGPDVGEEILAYARERNVSKILMGKPGRRGWRRWLLGSVVDAIIAQAHNINIYLLGSPRGGAPGAASGTARVADTPPRPRFNSRAYLWALAITGLCSAAAWLTGGGFDRGDAAMIYLLGVAVTAARHGRGPGLLASLLSVAAFDFLFVAPYFTFSVADARYLVTFVVMLLVAFIISHLTASLRSRIEAAAHRERRAEVLYALSKDLTACRKTEDIIGIAVHHIHAEFGGHSIILLPGEEGRITHPGERAGPQALSGADISVAQWVYDHGQTAGNGTDTLPGAPATYFPLAGPDGPLGVLAIKPVNFWRIFLPEQSRLMDAFLGQIAQALERVRMDEEAAAAQRRMESEGLRNSLLSAISHDLRTPLASIAGAASTLADEGTGLSEAERQELSRAIHEETLRMSHLTSNILDMARLDTGPTHLNRQWRPLAEVVGDALTRLGECIKERPVRVTLPQDLSLVLLDPALVEQLLVNLLDNAIKYTPAGSPIEIGAELSAFSLILSVADRGPGIPKGEEDKLFDKFYRLRKEDARGGAGLGLAICKAIADLHGGIIQASNRGGGGALFRVILPMNETPPPLGEEQENP